MFFPIIIIVIFLLFFIFLFLLLPRLLFKTIFTYMPLAACLWTMFDQCICFYIIFIIIILITIITDFFCNYNAFIFVVIFIKK